VHVRAAEVGLDRVDYQELRAHPDDGLLYPFIGEGELLFPLVYDMHSAAVGAKLLKPRLDGVGKPVLGGLEDDAAGDGAAASRQSRPGGDGGGDGESHRGLALVRVTLDDRNLAKGQVRRP
jgi:hypothetical protein